MALMTTILSVQVEQGLARRAEKASQGNLSSFVRDAIEEKVRTVENAKNNVVIAQPEKRTSPLHPNAWNVNEDFDQPLPDGFWMGKE